MTLCMYGHFTGSPRVRATRGYSRAGRKKAEAGRAGKGERCVLSSLRDRQAFWIAVLQSKLGFVRKPRI